MPDSLRTPAAAIDEWAEAAGGDDGFGGATAAAPGGGGGAGGGGEVAESRRALTREISSFEGLVTAKPSADPVEAMGQLPELAKMQAAHATFRAALGEAERRLAEARRGWRRCCRSKRG